MQAAYRRPSPPLQRDQQPSSSPEPQQPADAVVHVRVARQDAEEAASGAAAAAAAAAGAAVAAARQQQRTIVVGGRGDVEGTVHFDGWR